MQLRFSFEFIVIHIVILQIFRISTNADIQYIELQI